MNISDRGGYNYFITFTYDLSRYGYVYLMKYKFKLFEMFKWFHNEVEKQIGKNIKTLRSDRRGEYLSNEFLIYLEDNEILSHWIPPEIPQHNDISKRKNQILLDMVQSMMGFASLSIFFWGYTVETACFMLNNISSKSVSKIPYKIWSRHRPNLSYIRVWGCPTYVKWL